MNGTMRGIRNAFRNPTRTVSIVVILGLSVGLALSMLIAHEAVKNKIDTVKKSVGNTVSISPAGARGFEGGGTALTETQLAKVAKLSHVTSVGESLSDRLTSDDTDLESGVEAGSLGQRFTQRNGQSFSIEQGTPPAGMGNQPGSSNATVRTSFTPPVTVNGTNNPTDLSSSDTSGGGTFTLKNGKVFESGSSENVALIGTTLADKNDLKVGSTFMAYDAKVTVIGIFDAGNTFSNNQIIMPLTTVQKLSDQSGAITSARVTVDSVENVSSVTTAAKNALGDAADVTNDSERAEETIAPLKNILTISLYSLLGAVVAGAVIILLTMIMIVRERRREIGVLKAIGASNIKVMWQFMTEAVTLTILGAVIGIALAVVAAKPITNMLVTNSTSTSSSQTVSTNAGVRNGPMQSGGSFRGAGQFVGSSVSSITTNVGWNIIAYGLGVGVIIALAGSALAAFFIAKVRPAEVMRAE